MLQIVTYPNPVLRRKAETIEEIDDEIRNLIDDMAEAMYQDDGVGLAATQVGISKRLIVIDAGEGFSVLINPELVEKSKEEESMEEGCLSLPEIRLPIKRANRIVVKGLNEKGEPVQYEKEGLMARVYLHEIDHLNGVLIIDHASTVQRQLLRSKLKRLENSFSE